MKLQKKRSRNKGIAIGITGGIACGKSTVAQILTEKGVLVKDADKIAHEVIQPGSSIYDEILKLFGSEILVNDGKEIDRTILGQRVFSIREEREKLNKLVHPAVQNTYRTWINENKKNGKIVAVEVPLLFEIQDTEIWDAVICVTATKSNVLKRMFERGHSEKETLKRLHAQLPLAEKEELADYVIENNGSIDELRRKTKEILKEIYKGENNHAKSTK